MDQMRQIKAFLFDVDGVLSSEISPLDEAGEPVRTTNLKDGYAIRTALAAGYVIGIITGGRQDGVRLRYQKLGIMHIYDNVSDKAESLNDFITRTQMALQNVLYMGDDLPDYQVMKMVGLAACPSDAVIEIKAVSEYISERKGGEGCVRDVIEKVLRLQGKWINLNDEFYA